jgi:hypothetical protein
MEPTILCPRYPQAYESVLNTYTVNDVSVRFGVFGRLPVLKKLMFKLGLVACLSLYSIHFAILQGYAVNIPFWDEWDALNPSQLPAGLSFKWLFAQHNEHRIVTTRLVTWALYRLNGWNLVTHQTINFLLYGLLLIVIVLFAKRYVRQLDTWILFGFILFLLSPIDWDNHFWGFQMQFHFSLLFFLMTIYFLFNENQSWMDMLGGSAMAILAIYSFSSGLVSSITNLMFFAFFKAIRSYSASDPHERKRELKQLLIVVVVVSVSIALWFVDYHAVTRHPVHSMPYTWTFWLYFVNILGLGFGLDVMSFLPNFLCLMIVLTPVICDIWRKKGRLPNSSWAVFAAVGGILAALSVVTIGRASFGVEQSKSSRYSEIGMILVPLSVLTWSLLLQDRKKLRASVLLVLWLFCCVTFQNNWSEFSKYQEVGTQRSRGVLCIANYYAGRGDANCPSLYPESIAKKLDEASRLNLSFYRNIQPYIVLSRTATAAPVAEQKDTLYHIDIVDGRPSFKDAPVIIDALTTPDVTIGGWAIDSESQSEAADVFIVIDGHKEVATMYGQDRPDVAEANHNPRYRFSGFAASIPTSMLGKGRHILSLRILKASGDAYYEPVEKIDIEVR